METKVCKTCQIEKPVSEFNTAGRGKESKFGKQFYRSDCKVCQYPKMVEARRVSRMRIRLRERMPEAPYRAAVRILKEDNELLLHVANHRPHTFKKYLEEERMAIIDECVELSHTYGVRKNMRNREVVLAGMKKAIADVLEEIRQKAS